MEKEKVCENPMCEFNSHLVYPGTHNYIIYNGKGWFGKKIITRHLYANLKEMKGFHLCDVCHSAYLTGSGQAE